MGDLWSSIIIISASSNRLELPVLIACTFNGFNLSKVGSPWDISTRYISSATVCQNHLRTKFVEII